MANGTLVFTGGNEFSALHDRRSAEVAALAPAGDVVVLATAAAFEGVAAVQATAEAWCRRLDRAATAVPVLHHRDITAEHAELVAQASMVLITDGSPLHLRSVLKGSSLVSALESCLAAGGLVLASGASGTVFGDPMVDPRGGAFTVGLGLASGLALFPGPIDRAPPLWTRAKALLASGATLAGIDEGAALVRTDGQFRVIGDGSVITFDGAAERNYSVGDTVEF